MELCLYKYTIIISLKALLFSKLILCVIPPWPSVWNTLLNPEPWILTILLILFGIINVMTNLPCNLKARGKKSFCPPPLRTFLQKMKMMTLIFFWKTRQAQLQTEKITHSNHPFWLFLNHPPWISFFCLSLHTHCLSGSQPLVRVKDFYW